MVVKQAPADIGRSVDQLGGRCLVICTDQIAVGNHCAVFLPVHSKKGIQAQMLFTRPIAHDQENDDPEQDNHKQ